MQGEPNPLQVAKWEAPLYWHGEKVKQLSGGISAQPWSLLVQLRLSGWLLKLELQNCLLDNGNCHHISTNSPGSVSCYCKAGYNAVSVLKRISNAQKASEEEVCGKKNAYPEQRSRCRPGQYLARNRTVPEKAMAEGKTKKRTEETKVNDLFETSDEDPLKKKDAIYLICSLSLFLFLLAKLTILT